MHIGVIPDGNRRYMKKNAIPALQESYDMGINKFHEFLEWSIDLGVDEVTVYALSIENLENRSKEEVATLLALFSEHAIKSLEDARIHEMGVKVNFCGDPGYLREFDSPVGSEVVENLAALEDATREYKGLTLNMALAYGGRQEILAAARSVAGEGCEINEENLKKHLWVKDYPEIVLRTSESRLSNFMLWQAAYSEIYFVDKLWQELQKQDLQEILSDYHGRDRRFGR